MAGKLAKKYLAFYTKTTIPLFKNFFTRKEKEACLSGEIPLEIVKRLSEMSKQGKKLRGALTVLGYKLGGKKADKKIYEASLSVELLHAGLLIHDDIMDEDVVRRGKPSLFKQFEKIGNKIRTQSPKQYGIALAIDAGDLTFYLSWEKLLASNFPSACLLRAGRLYACYIQRLAYGQALDITNSRKIKKNEKDILSVLRLKSAEYSCVFPLLLGATLGGLRDKKILKAIEKYGLCLGLAFQIKDDILGIFGDEDKIGKPIGSDLRENKITLLTLHLLKHGTKEQKDFLNKILGKKNITRRDIQKTRQIFKATGSYDYAVTLVNKYVNQGKKVIPDITNNSSLQSLLVSFLEFMTERVS